VRRFLLDLLALTLILIAPFAVLLSFNGYSYTAPEVLLIAGLALATAAVVAALLGFAHELIRAVVFAALIALFIEMHFELPAWPSLGIAAVFLAAVAALAGILWLLRLHATKILAVIFVTLIGLTLVRSDSTSHQIVREEAPVAKGSDTGPPLLIHLLLDEHIGVAGLPSEIPGAQELRPELIDFYTSRGFRLFGRAYSQYANTYNSIANLLNFASHGESHPYLLHGADETAWGLKQSAYFQMLQQRGYRLHVYQSTYLDLCHVENVQLQGCTTYPVSSLGMLQDLQLPAVEKARAIGNAIVTQSKVMHVLNKVYERGIRGALQRVGLDAPEWRWQPPSFGPLRVPTVFDRLSEDILEHPRGHAFFAHLIMPHYPYVWDRNCALRERTSEWLTNHISSPDALVYNTPDSRARKYERYFEQVRCVFTMVDELLMALDSRGLLADATIIVNGDHGSRIPKHFPSGATLASGVLSEKDYSDTFSTLYAVKAPDVSPGYDDAPRSVVELLDHDLAGEPLRAPSSCRVFLLEENGDGTLTAVEPKFCAP